MNLTLKVWKQKNAESRGSFETYQAKDISSEMSFLEMFDVLNERLISEGKEPIAFDHDCREGICGTCSMYINGRPHGPWHATTTCQLHMRAFKDGDTIVVEPWRAKAFPVIKEILSQQAINPLFLLDFLLGKTDRTDPPYFASGYNLDEVHS